MLRSLWHLLGTSHGHFNRCTFLPTNNLPFFSLLPPFLIIHFKADNASQSCLFLGAPQKYHQPVCWCLTYMLHANKSICFLSNYFISLKLSSPLFMAAVVSIFSQEQIQGLGFFFAYFLYRVWHFHTLGWGLVFTPNYIFRHRRMSASSHFWLELILGEMIKGF